jgi:CHAT domain-containing protein/Tfp pilus assembly protein PilF
MSGGKMLRARVRRADHALCILICFATTLCSAQGTQSVEPMPIPLRDGQTLSATHEATERFTYVVDVADDATYLVRVDQRGLDLIVTVETPAQSTDSFNSPLFRHSGELVVLASAVAGSFRVTVHSDEHTGALGGHAIALTKLTPPADARELDAWGLMSAGGAANFDSGEEGWAAAVDAYVRAAALWRELGRTREQADALFSVATIEYWQLFSWDRAADLAASAAALYADLGEAALAANAVHLQGAALVEKALESAQSSTGVEISPETEALFATALQLLEDARATHEQLGNVYDLGLVTNNFGYTHYSKGELDEARVYYQQAAALMQSAGEWTGELNPRANIGVLDIEAGHLISATETFERILEILPPGKSLRYRADTLNSLGTAQRMLGNVEQGLETFSAALEIQKDLDDAQGRGQSLRRIGEVYYSLGELDLAAQYLEQALPIAAATNDGRNREATLRNLGNVAHLREDYLSALEFHRSALGIAASASDRAHLQLLIAKDLRALGRYDEARDSAEEAKRIGASSGSELLFAGALHELGRAQLAQGDTNAAIANLVSAAAAYSRLGLGAEHAEALHGLALAAAAEDDLHQAVEYGEAALSELESLRLRVADPELRAFFSAIRRSHYETQIDWLMTLHARSHGSTVDYLRAAFATSERSRARLTTDLLHEASVDLRNDFDVDLQVRQTDLYDQLAERGHQRNMLLEEAGSDDASRSKLQRVLADLAAIETDLKLVEIDLRRTSPRFASLRAPEPLTTSQIQTLLGPDTMLLQYALGERASYVWVVSRDSIIAIELADRSTIEAAARRALDSVKTYAPGASAGPGPSVELTNLAELVLAPVAAHLRRTRIVLALDGALSYIPFAVLPVSGADGQTNPLLADHEVVAIPSMSSLDLPPRGDAAQTIKTLAVFADPVLEANDPRFGSAPPMPLVAAASPVDLGTRLSVGAGLGRLLSTAYEADSISALVPDDAQFTARGFAASRDTVFEADLGQYRFIHFATHGLVDSRYPGLSALALSRFDVSGTPQNGYLRLNDIYNLKLNADLVVLSACETALGREVRGEGLIGLTQGFMYAGARSLIASLWQVPDRATAELMTRFYSYMLTEGLRPAEALRKAQLASAAERRWSHPYFWGGFVLLGDWR